MTSTRTIALVAVSSLMLAGCLGSNDEPSISTPASSTQTSAPSRTTSTSDPAADDAPSGSSAPQNSSPTTTSPGSPDSTTPTSPSTSASVPMQKGPVEGAPGTAGGKRPAEATPITSIRHDQYIGDVAVLLTPSGNIGCEFGATYAGCGVESWAVDKKFGSDPQFGPPWWVTLHENKVPQVSPKGDAPYYKDPDTPAQVIQYGQTVYWGKYVCSSQQAGLTCWNTDTGHGAFMSRDSFRPF